MATLIGSVSPKLRRHRRSGSRPARTFAFLLTAGGALACAPATLPPSSPSPLLGAPLPAFSGTTVNGSEFDSNESRGLVLVVVLSMLGKGPSDRNLDTAGALYADHRDLVVVGVSLDDSIDDARRQAARHELHFPLLADPDRRVASRLGVTRAGTVLVVDRRGVLRWVGVAPSEDRLRQATDALLAESARN